MKKQGIISKLCKTTKGEGFWTESVMGMRIIHSFKTRKQAGDAREKYIKDHPEMKVL